MGMKYYQIDGVPFSTNAVPAKGAVEIDKVEHDALAKASIKLEPVYEPVPDPLEERLKIAEDEITLLKGEIILLKGKR